jgi:menaquinone-specific isochorismate synthase
LNSLADVLKQIQLALSGAFSTTPGLQQITMAFSLGDGSDALAWLAGQRLWPQFYWQQRSGDEELAALGACATFSDMPAAQAFLAQYADAPELALCGLNAFDPAQGRLFLPRLLWQRRGAAARMTLNLYSAVSVNDDVPRARDFLARLSCSRALKPLQLACIKESQQPDRAQWGALIARATDAIAAGEFDKVVLARVDKLHFSRAPDAAALMAASRRVNGGCYHFFMAFDAERAFLGSSPERLWRRTGDRLRTEALAGTVAGDPDDAQAAQLGDWLMHDDKNQRENMLVVEDICQRLQGVCGVLEVLAPQVVRLRKVQHLRRCIWTTLNAGGDDLLCLERLQPTAAVAGLPRDAARQFIARHEPFTREWYAGSAGWLSARRSEFCVTLRCALIEGARVRLYAGAGIVAGSQAEHEWQEVNNKAAGLRSLFFATPD